MLLFPFHTLHANALWKVPSEFPPGRSEGGKRLGRNRRLQPHRGSASPWERPRPPSCAHPVRTRGVGPWDPLPARPREQTSALACALCRALGRMPEHSSSLPGGRSGQAPGAPASCLDSQQHRGEIPRPSLAAQRPCWPFKCAQAEFRSKPRCNAHQK